jgi:EpsI family protein
MGNKIETKLIVLSVLFLLTSAFVYWRAEPSEAKKKPALNQYFEHVNGYKTLRHIAMEDAVVQMLDLDDYTFTDYKGESGKVNLYIGYYYAADKAYASHSPMVCYPSQGWKIDEQPVKYSLAVGPNRIHYEEIITSNGPQKELVLYWYQSHLLTNTQVYKNKIDMAYNKLTKNDEQHGFVRVSVPIANSTYDAAKKAATDFIQAFYPNFIEFIKGEGTPRASS